MSKVKLEHEKLDSNIATAAALFNEWIKWCNRVGIKPYAIPHITEAFNVLPADYEKRKQDKDAA